MSQESKELVVLNNTALSSVVAALPDEFEESAVRRKKDHYVRLIMGDKSDLIKAGYSIGSFVDTEAAESFTEAEIVIMPFFYMKDDAPKLKAFKGGRKFQSKYKPGQNSKTYCVSNNRITPVPGTEQNGLTPKSEDCESCAYGSKAWERYRQTKNSDDIPKNCCELTATIRFYRADEGTQPYLFNPDGNSRKIVEEFIETLNGRIDSIKNRTGVRPRVWHFVIKLSAQTNKAGNYEPVLKIVELLSDEDRAFYDGIVNASYQGYLSYIATKQAEDAAEDVDQAIEDSGNEVESEPTTTVSEPVEPVKPKVNIPAASTRRTGARPAYKPQAQPEVLAPEKTEDEEVAKF